MRLRGTTQIYRATEA